MVRGHDEVGNEGSAAGAMAWHVVEVDVGYDDQAKVYYVPSSDVPGLNIESPDFETFVAVALDAAPDLLVDRHPRTRLSFRRSVELTSADGR